MHLSSSKHSEHAIPEAKLSPLPEFDSSQVGKNGRKPTKMSKQKKRGDMTKTLGHYQIYGPEIVIIQLYSIFPILCSFLRHMIWTVPGYFIFPVQAVKWATPRVVRGRGAAGSCTGREWSLTQHWRVFKKNFMKQNYLEMPQETIGIFQIFWVRLSIFKKLAKFKDLILVSKKSAESHNDFSNVSEHFL